MKKIFVFTSLILNCSNMFAMSVFYNNTNGNIITIGNVDMAETDVIKRGDISDNNPILKEDLNKVYWDSNAKTIVKKPQVELLKIDDDKKKLSILYEYRNIRRQLEDAQKDIADGFDTPIPVQTLNDKIIDLKTQYQLIKGK